MSQSSSLYSPTELKGGFTLPNRVLMAPLTRNRAYNDGTPKPMAATYYRQRASAGLIISEATQVSAMGKGYLDTPGIYSDKHIEGWRKITDSVHAAGGRIFCQLWHVGRISHTSLLDGKQPVAPSAIQAASQTFTAEGFQDCSMPVALDAEGIESTLEDYAYAAKCAKEAGFDGIEVHSANGYLLDQFLQSSTNHRDDNYGGTIENRARFLEEVLSKVLSVWPKERVGVRLSPLGQFNDMGDDDPYALFAYVYKKLSEKSLAYLHVVESFPGSEKDSKEQATLHELRGLYDGFYIANGGYDADAAIKAILSGHADAVTFGRPFIANPDLPQRYYSGAPLNTPNENTFYGGGEEGYTDYPSLES